VNPASRTSVAYGVNNKGEVVGYSDLPGGTRHMFLWKQGQGMKDLGAPSGSTAEARAINENSQVVGYATLPGQFAHAFLLDKGIFTDLGTLPTGNVSSAAAINLGGTVVGSSNKRKPNSSNHETHAALWTTP